MPCCQHAYNESKPRYCLHKYYKNLCTDKEPNGFKKGGEKPRRCDHPKWHNLLLMRLILPHNQQKNVDDTLQ